MVENRIEQESVEDRDTRLGDMRVHATRQPHVFDQSLLTKVTAFHNKLELCDFHTCEICNESFPAGTCSPKSPCTHCLRDNHQPKTILCTWQQHGSWYCTTWTPRSTCNSRLIHVTTALAMQDLDNQLLRSLTIIWAVQINHRKHMLLQYIAAKVRPSDDLHQH